MRIFCSLALTMSAIAMTLPVMAEDPVVLKTTDFEVTMQDFEYYLNAQEITGERRARTLSKEGAVEKVFENMYLIRALAADGERNKAIDKDEIDWLARSYRERLLMNRQLDLEVEEAIRSVDLNALAEEEYKANKDRFTKGEQVSAAHILISFDDRSEEQALGMANEVHSRLNKGEEFGELSKEFSDDSGSASKGGELGFFQRGRMVKPFEEAAFALTTPGEVSDPVKSKFGYHIIRYNGRKPQQTKSFEQAKSAIMPAVKKRTEQAIRQDKMAEVQAEAEAEARGLEVDLLLLKEIQERYVLPVEDRPAKQ